MNLDSFKKMSKTKLAGIAIIVAVLIFAAWELLMGFPPSAVRVIDSRISFQFTVYKERDEYFVSYSLANTKDAKVKAFVRVQLVDTGPNGKSFRAVKGLNNSEVLEPLETKSFVTKFELPKPKKLRERDLSPTVKIRRVTRA